MTTNHPTTRWRLPYLLAAVVLLLAACGVSSDEDSAAVSDTSFFEESADDGGGDDADMAEEEAEFDLSTADSDDAMMEEPATDAATGDDALAQATGLTPADLGRDIIFRATIAVEVDDVAAAGEEATQHIEALGGIVFGQTTRTDPAPRTVLTFKVAPGDFDTALERLAGVGELVDQTISADDVTDRIVDLESRIVTAETSVDRLREFLSNATTVQDVAALERELVDRETELETLRGQLRTLRDQVSLATITLEIAERGTDPADAEFDLLLGLGVDLDDACPGAAELDVEHDDTVVWCVEIENLGDATLTDVELDSDNLGLRTRDFTVVDGSLDAIEPGEITRAVIELDVEEGRIRRRNAVGGLFLDLRIEATPTDDPERTLAVERNVVVFADSDAALPGAAESFQRGVDVLVAAGSILLIVVAGLAPFMPLVLIVVFGVRFVRRRRTSTPTIEE